MKRARIVTETLEGRITVVRLGWGQLRMIVHTTRQPYPPWGADEFKSLAVRLDPSGVERLVNALRLMATLPPRPPRVPGWPYPDRCTSCGLLKVYGDAYESRALAAADALVRARNPVAWVRAWLRLRRQHAELRRWRSWWPPEYEDSPPA